MARALVWDWPLFFLFSFVYTCCGSFFFQEKREESGVFGVDMWVRFNDNSSRIWY